MKLSHLTFLSALPLVVPHPADAARPLSAAQGAMAALPAWFEPNTGQYPEPGAFFSRGAEGALLVERDGAVFAEGGRALRLRWEGTAVPTLTGGARMPGRSSYYTGGDAKRWRRGVPQYAAVHARQIYSGVDLVYYVWGKQVEFDVVVAPGVDPATVRFSFPDGQPVRNADGDLVFANGMRQRAPVAYQEIAGKRVGVESAYRIAGDGMVSFEIGQYDASRPLTIDPILQAGYMGGDQNDAVNGVAVDSQGNLWIAGSSLSTPPLPPQYAPIQDGVAGGKDAFVAKLVPAGNGKMVLAYWTQLGGTSDDAAMAIKTDANGFVYVAGSTASIDFPRAGASTQNAHGGETDAFVAKIRIEDSAMDALWYSQFFGGNGRDVANALALDANGSIYIAGQSLSDSLPGVEGVGLQCCRRGGDEGFVAKFIPDASPSLTYATYLGGTSTDAIYAIAVDAEGSILIAGDTSSGDFPVTSGSYQDFMRSATDAFLVKIDLRRPGLDALVYGTYLGGSALDSARSMALAENGDVWIAGYTLALDFPVTPNALNTGNSGESDAFLTRFRINSPDPSQSLVYSSYLGGRGSDILYGLAAGSGGEVALTGYTYSNDFPLSPSGSGPSPLHGAEAFLTHLDTTQPGRSALLYSVTIGGSNVDSGTAVAFDRAGNLFAAGYTKSGDLPVTDGSSKLSPGGSSQGFVMGAMSTPEEAAARAERGKKQ